MVKDTTPASKIAPKPSKASKELSKYFELQIIDVAMDSYKEKQYLQSALLSWSYIEEYFLPTFIKFVASKHKIPLERNIIDNATTSTLIKYYYLISHDKELYELLKEANKKRNKLIHELFKSGSLKEITVKAEQSAKYNLKNVAIPTFDRLNGKFVPPSLMLYTNGWNDCRDKTKENIIKAFS